MSDATARHDIDLREDGEKASSQGGHRALAQLVAVTVIILSVFMAITKVKDDNIVQAMQQAKTEAVDLWAEYQANKLKQHMAEQAIGRDKLLETMPGIDVAAVKTHMAQEVDAGEKYRSRAVDLMAKAREREAYVAQLGRIDDQFDMSDALLAIALAISATAILADSFGALAVGWFFGVAGAVMGFVGFLGGSLRIEWLINLLN